MFKQRRSRRVHNDVVRVTVVRRERQRGGFPRADLLQPFGIIENRGGLRQGVSRRQLCRPDRPESGHARYRFHPAPGRHFSQSDTFADARLGLGKGPTQRAVLMRNPTVDPADQRARPRAVLKITGRSRCWAWTPVFRWAVDDFADITELGGMPVHRHNSGDPDFDGLWFWDDGTFYRVRCPTASGLRA